jgi:hypothetical protein
MWGQGLPEQNKFYTLVENYIKSKYSIPVNTEVLAHSGAVIGDGDFSGPIFRWDKAPGEDEAKFRKLLILITPPTPMSILLNTATIVKADQSTIKVSQSCLTFIHGTFCIQATASLPVSADRADITVSISSGTSGPVLYSSSYSLRVEDISGEQSVFYGPLYGEIPTSFPTILQQVRYYNGPIQPKNVDLVLVDGCIDVTFVVLISVSTSVIVYCPL